MNCRTNCGACCIAPSITSAIPGLPHGKPAGVRCVQLGEDLRCRLFGLPERPAVCSSFKPMADVCGMSGSEALLLLSGLEASTL
jgi:Fe-S-cluster containining protein